MNVHASHKQSKGTIKHRVLAISKILRRFSGLVLVFCVLAMPQSAWAQSKMDTVSQATKYPSQIQTTPGLSFNMASGAQAFDMSPTFKGALIDLPLDSVGSGLFDLDVRDPGCLTNESFCLTRESSQTLEIGYNQSKFLSLNSRGLDLELTPRANVHFDDDTSGALVGALVRIGDDLRRDSDFDSNTWYVFAGADAEALTYRPNSPSRLTRGNFNLQDRIIVGDAQAGLGYRIGDADVSLAYIRREVSGFGGSDALDELSYKEDAAALSFTWRR